MSRARGDDGRTAQKRPGPPQLFRADSSATSGWTRIDSISGEAVRSAHDIAVRSARLRHVLAPRRLPIPHGRPRRFRPFFRRARHGTLLCSRRLA
jgi:hypothetical protein